MLTQEDFKEMMLPILKEKGQLYAKFLPIIARKAKSGEKIQTITADGLETENVAEGGDFIVQNQTKAGEQYIINARKFQSRYQLLEKLEGELARYQPIGKAWGLEFSADLAKELNLKLPFHFIASWGAPMILKENDFLVCPPDYRSVYRIARQEFFETYRSFT